jgi:hypothetical protein
MARVLCPNDRWQGGIGETMDCGAVLREGSMSVGNGEGNGEKETQCCDAADGRIFMWSIQMMVVPRSGSKSTDPPSSRRLFATIHILRFY